MLKYHSVFEPPLLYMFNFFQVISEVRSVKACRCAGGRTCWDPLDLSLYIYMPFLSFFSSSLSLSLPLSLSLSLSGISLLHEVAYSGFTPGAFRNLLPPQRNLIACSLHLYSPTGCVYLLEKALGQCVADSPYVLKGVSLLKPPEGKSYRSPKNHFPPAGLLISPEVKARAWGPPIGIPRPIVWYQTHRLFSLATYGWNPPAND